MEPRQQKRRGRWRRAKGHEAAGVRSVTGEVCFFSFHGTWDDITDSKNFAKTLPSIRSKLANKVTPRYSSLDATRRIPARAAAACRGYWMPVMATDKLDTNQKALQINLDASKYGTCAEIGAGQEVARCFFRVGGASGTVAKTISAYDLAVSDAIYGPCERYVSRQRLQAMLDYEFDLLRQRLDKMRGDKCTFFVFANTVATHSFTRQEEGHG